LRLRRGRERDDGLWRVIGGGERSDGPGRVADLRLQDSPAGAGGSGGGAVSADDVLPGERRAGPDEETWQVDHWGLTAAAARGASEALFTGLDGYSARAPGAGEAYRAICENTSDDYEPDTELYRVTQFWRVWHRE